MSRESISYLSLDHLWWQIVQSAAERLSPVRGGVNGPPEVCNFYLSNTGTDQHKMAQEVTTRRYRRQILCD